jgi:hypothetical protein
MALHGAYELSSSIFTPPQASDGRRNDTAVWFGCGAGGQEMFHCLTTTNLPHSRFLLHYNPSSTNPALSVVASGQNPVVKQWRDNLQRLHEKGEAVIFGYGEFEGKGCILLYLSDIMAYVTLPMDI